MKRILHLTCLVLFTKFSIAQFWDTFESYANQTEADMSWPSTDVGKIRVNTTNDNIDINSVSDLSTDLIYYDLGSGNVSNTQWVLRGAFNFTTLSTNNTGIYFGISSTTGGQNSVQDGISMCWRYTGTNPKRIAHFDADNSTYVIGTDYTGYTFSTGVNYYVELIRTSATSFDLNVFTNSDYSSGQIINYSGTTLASVQNLRYIKICNIDGGSGPGQMVGTLDDVQFCNGTTTFNCNPTPLPIDLLSFSAKWRDNSYETAIVNWQTAYEYDNDYFDIERSIDGLNFTPIAQIEGTNNGIIINNYEYLDESPYTDGVSYYRLKQVDNNGDVFYSNIDALNVPQGLEIISIYPNPVINNLNFHVLSSLDIEIQINIFNTLGQLIIEENQPVQKGLNTMGLNTERINNGHYFMEISTSNGEYSVQKKFVVEKRTNK